MEKRNIDVNLDDYTIYYNKKEKNYIAVSQEQREKISELMEPGLDLSKVDATVMAACKILNYNEQNNTYSIDKNIIFEVPVKDLEVTVIRTGGSFLG